MSTSKRRRLNTEESTQPRSAFALRKKLLAQQSQAASPPTDQAHVAGNNSPLDADKVSNNTQKKVKKAKTPRPASVERNETAHGPSELRPSRALDELPAPRASPADEAPRSPSPFSPSEAEEDYHISGPAQPVNLSSYRPSKSNFHKKSNGVIRLTLDEGERLVILGSYGVRVESGEVAIYGATLKASKVVSWFHAPQSHALPVIRCASDAALELRPHPGAQEIEDLGLLSPLFRKLWCESASSSPNEKESKSSDTFRILYTSDDGPKRAVLQDLKTPPEWNREMATLVASKDPVHSSIMITGPKSSGKSTFGKILTNRLLTSIHPQAKRSSDGGVVILDLDPGQPEYCGPGQIALILVTKPVLSPSFCRPVDYPGIRTIRSHALASLSPASDPQLYTEMALDLITHYRNAFRSYPLVINTPGWIQGTGLDLLVSLISDLRPTDVIYMSQTGPADAVEALEGACNATRFSTLPSQPSQNSLRSAAHLRSMQTMAYFHAKPATGHNGKDHLRWYQTPLTAMAPWQVHFKGASCSIFGVLCYDFQTQPDLVADAINGAILVAVEVESTKAFRDIENDQLLLSSAGDEAAPGFPMELDMGESDSVKSSSLSLLKQKIATLTPEGIPFIDSSHGLTLDPRHSRSLGLVLVRGIDVENGDLHLLCPITTSQVEDVRTRGGQIVLVSGKLDPPTWAYTEDLYFQSRDQGVDGNEDVDIDGQAEGIEADSEDMRGDDAPTSSGNTESVPWIEVLTTNQKRGAGSKVWRVRRDLGRAGNN